MRPSEGQIFPELPLYRAISWNSALLMCARWRWGQWR